MSVYEKKALESIGEGVVILVNMFGWIALVGFLMWGMIAALMIVIPTNNTEEVTIEQAE